MVLGYLVRAGVIIGTVYYTKKIGVWGNPEEAEELYIGIRNQLLPHARRLEKHLPFDVPALPESSEVRYLARHYYNEGVKSTFHFIEFLPCYTGQMLVKAKDAFNDFSQPPPPSPTSTTAETAPTSIPTSTIKKN